MLTIRLPFVFSPLPSENMITKLLIANRGEIACRIIRTCQRLGVRTVAVYSEADRNAQHVRLADEACGIGEAPPAQSYLQGERILDVAQRYQADAVHPGYGFLSEQAAFARACAAAGVIFVGPPPEAMERMGTKDEAKRLMAAAGVPVVPGYHGPEQALPFLQEEAERIGYPVLIKAVAGGGGKGMRVVSEPSAFADALRSARQEAKGAFGDDRVLLERFVSGPRHLEVQVFGDTQGQVLHCFERECSLQRRHQKVVEEAPSPLLEDATRQALTAAAVQAARAVGYVNAGTVEFIMDDQEQFFFMEMNTRLQVEHPVTEAITGHDLVEWQLRIASGEPLPVTQEQLQRCGHALEVRIYAEHPESGFLPSTGTLQRLQLPEPQPGVRVDSGVVEGDVISPYYDPMLAKLIVSGRTRAEALTRLQEVLAETFASGLHTNLGFLQTLLRQDAVQHGHADTLFIDQHLAELLTPPEVPEPVQWAAALAVWHSQRPQHPQSPWERFDNWRLGGAEPHRLRLQGDLGELQVQAHLAASGEAATFLRDADAFTVQVTPGVRWELRWNNQVWKGQVFLDAEDVWVLPQEGAGQGSRFRLKVLPELEGAAAGEEEGLRLTAPMPGSVTQVWVSPGDAVQRGQPLVTMEAMKMEHTLTAPEDCFVAAVHFPVGALVSAEAQLVTLSEDAPTGEPVHDGA